MRKLTAFYNRAFVGLVALSYGQISVAGNDLFKLKEVKELTGDNASGFGWLTDNIAKALGALGFVLAVVCLYEGVTTVLRGVKDSQKENGEGMTAVFRSAGIGVLLIIMGLGLVTIGWYILANFSIDNVRGD